MTTFSSHGASRRARTRGAPAGRWVERLARLGYAAKGVVYLLVGLLAVRVALGGSGTATDSEGALRTIGAQPFGRVLLVLTAVGLLAYAAWRLVQSTTDPDDEGAGAAAIVKRLGYGCSGFVYLGLAGIAVRRALGIAGGGDARQAWTARLMEQPFGRWLVGLVGLTIIGLGLFHFAQVYTARFMRRYDLRRMEASERTWAQRIGRFGLGARGVTFCIIGGFFVQAARRADAREAQGLEAAFSALAGAPFGRWMLGIVAAGFVAYGVYCFSRSRYRRFAPG